MSICYKRGKEKCGMILIHMMRTYYLVVKKDTCVDCAVEHVFEVVLQGVRGLKLLETMIWGEADCFVQYFFPVQGQAQHQGPAVAFGESSRLLGDESLFPLEFTCVPSLIRSATVDLQR